jgi:hypothetical protein
MSKKIYNNIITSSIYKEKNQGQKFENIDTNNYKVLEIQMISK